MTSVVLGYCSFCGAAQSNNVHQFSIVGGNVIFDLVRLDMLVDAVEEFLGAFDFCFLNFPPDFDGPPRADRPQPNKHAG